MLSGRSAGWLLCLVLASAACRDESAPGRPDSERLDQGPRVFQPPVSVVRAVPPHRIEPDGIGPYRLGTELKDILNTLPGGPRVELLQIDRLVGYRLVRAAPASILVGIGAGGRVSFVGALDREIAKTENGFGVGSEIETLREALGPERTMMGARDPRLVELARLPGARLIVEDGRVTAIVVVADASPDAPHDIAPADALSGGGSPAGKLDRGLRASAGKVAAAPVSSDDGERSCTVASAVEALGGKPIAEVARADKAVEARVYYGCFTGTAAEAVVEDGNELVLVAGDTERLRRAATLSVEGLVFAGAVDTDGDGRHELVAVSEARSDEAIAVSVELLRGENGRLVRTAAEEVYRATSGAAASVGAKQLKDVSLLIEVYAGDESLQVTGFYLHRAGAKVRTVAPLLPRTILLGPHQRGGGGAGTTRSETDRARIDR